MNRVSPIQPPADVPGGTAKIAEPTWRMYSFERVVPGELALERR